MSNYSTVNSNLQVINALGVRIYYDPSSGCVVQSLQDDQFAWRARKLQTLRLADLYGMVGDKERQFKARMCATWLEYKANDAQTVRALNHFNACHLRICPLCAARRARILAGKLLATISKVEKDAKRGEPAAILNGHKEVKFLFLTLTVKNCVPDDLGKTLDLMTHSWSKLMRRRRVERAIIGWYRAIEITRNRDKGTYHPHMHVILAVTPDYFRRASGMYITQADWVRYWQESLQVKYRPVVSIEGVRGKDRGGKDYEVAVVEAAKYCVKDQEYIDPMMPDDEAADVVKTYTSALAGRRLVAMGGIIRQAAKSIGIDTDDDDVIGDGDELSIEAAKYLEEYVWFQSVKDHILTDVRDNPDYIGGMQQGSESRATPPASGASATDP